MALLEIRNLSVSFGGIQALRNVSLDVIDRSIHCLIGPNGSGKTTLFNVISRFYDAREGRVLFAGNDLLRCRPHEIPCVGIYRTFQNLQLFGSMTVLENVMVGLHNSIRTEIYASALRLGSERAKELQAIKRAKEFIAFVGLEGLENVVSKNLPFGKQKLVELARAVASGPRVLLLDEPAAGMNLEETIALNELVLAIKNRLDVAVLLVEHDMNVVRNISDYVTVLSFGEKIAEGSYEMVKNNERVIEAYLGKEKVDAES